MIDLKKVFDTLSHNILKRLPLRN